MAKDGAVAEPEGKIVTKDGRRYKVLETPIDPPLTVKRTLVPIDTEEEDIPEGSVLLNEYETQGLLRKSTRPENIEVGHTVRLKTPAGELEPDDPAYGKVTMKGRSGMVKVRWDKNGLIEKYNPSDLQRVH